MREFEKALDLFVTDYPEFSLGKLCSIPQKPAEIHVQKAVWEGTPEIFPYSSIPATLDPSLIL